MFNFYRNGHQLSVFDFHAMYTNGPVPTPDLSFQDTFIESLIFEMDV